jgi:RNA polymerase sigma-70 factor (ECF subfamily)
MRYAYTKDDMNEIVNDGFLKIFKELHTFKAVFDDKEISLKGWIKRIMINTSIDHHRKYHKQKMMSGSQDETAIEKTEYHSETALDKLSYEEIMKKVHSLSPVYRTVFNMHVIDGLTHEEIASQLGISVGTSKSNLFKAKANLKKMLESQNSIVYE